MLRPEIALCFENGDHATRDLLERIVVDEERHIDRIEAPRRKIAEVGDHQDLAQQNLRPDARVASPCRAYPGRPWRALFLTPSDGICRVALAP